MLPFAYRPATGMDLSSAPGARKQRALIQGYWAKQGYYRLNIIVMDTAPEEARNRGRYYGCLSDMHNGMPRT